MNSNLFFIIFFIACATSIVQAQNTTFAVLGGVNFQTFSGKAFNGNDLDNSIVTGFHLGGNVQIPIAPEFYFQPGLLFSTKGADINETIGTSTYALSYIELPLNFVYKGALGNGFVFVGFGPYLGYGIKGSASFENPIVGIDSDIAFQNTVEATDDITKTYFKALDAGANIFVGYEMAMGAFIQLNTQLGMLKINPKDNRFSGGETSVKNTGFGLSVGYRF